MKSKQMEQSAFAVCSSYAAPRAGICKALCEQAGLELAYAAIFYHGVRMCRPEGYILHRAMKELRPFAMAEALKNKRNDLSAEEFAWVMTDYSKATWALGVVERGGFVFSEGLRDNVRDWAAYRKDKTVAEWRARVREHTAYHDKMYGKKKAA